MARHIWRSPENNQTRAYTFKNTRIRTIGRPPTRELRVSLELEEASCGEQPRPVTGCYAYKEEENNCFHGNV
ncbi:hypothetical protein TNCV_101 [Trichonephila clavipes]|nr:hypothetical protein TNCV_101 [Trichonephila clavipes]